MAPMIMVKSKPIASWHQDPNLLFCTNFCRFCSALKAHLRDNYYATLNSDDDITVDLELLIPPDDYVVTDLDEHPQLLPEGITREQWEAIPEQQPLGKRQIEPIDSKS